VLIYGSDGIKSPIFGNYISFDYTVGTIINKRLNIGNHVLTYKELYTGNGSE